MGAFNCIVVDRKCLFCGTRAAVEVQFKYGDKWQHTYSVGDVLRWGGNDEGVPGVRRVIVEGVTSRCETCAEGGEDVDGDYYDIVIELDKIIDVYQIKTPREESRGDGWYLVELE